MCSTPCPTERAPAQTPPTSCFGVPDSRAVAFSILAQGELEAAPDPSNFEAAFFRCEDDLMHYDFATESGSTLIGESIEHLGLEVLSLGVAVNF